MEENDPVRCDSLMFCFPLHKCLFVFLVNADSFLHWVDETFSSTCVHVVLYKEIFFENVTLSTLRVGDMVLKCHNISVYFRNNDLLKDMMKLFSQDIWLTSYSNACFCLCNRFVTAFCTYYILPWFAVCQSFVSKTLPHHTTDIAPLFGIPGISTMVNDTIWPNYTTRIPH